MQRLMTDAPSQGAFYEGASDEDLMAASLEDPEPFGVLYDRHSRDLLRYFYARVASPQVAADLTAETFAVAFQSRNRYKSRGDAGVRAWLYGIAHHQLGRYVRHQRVDFAARRRLGLPRVELDDESIERIEHLVDLRSLVQAVRDEVVRLSTPLRQALVLRVVDGLTYAEVARRLVCSEGAARVRVSRALRLLADALEERGLEP
jgi:RNA polymerase sigma-70 factor, ECF subfamily